MDSLSASTLAGRGVAYAPAIVTAARAHGLDPTLLAAVAAQETGGPSSNGGRNIVGDGGHGRGLFQIDDRYHAFARTPTAMDPDANARYAAGMLSGLIERYGSVHRALSAYNAGNPDAAGTVTQWSDGQRLGYADSVLRHQREIAGRAAPANDAAVMPQQIAEAPLELALPPPAHRHTYKEE
jgi:soluble lytic murein transglycosylase-like protein